MPPHSYRKKSAALFSHPFKIQISRAAKKWAGEIVGRSSVWNGMEMVFWFVANRRRHARQTNVTNTNAERRQETVKAPEGSDDPLATYDKVVK